MANFRGPVMSRIAVAASISLAGLLPVCAAALGLGEIQSRSFLNQPLAAEIPVLSEAPGELSGLTVDLASPETFSQYGLQRPTFLGDLAFAVQSGAAGPVIRITSAQPVMEPFVTMLLEVRWSQGRLLREYTVLLDPPSFTGGAVRQPVQAPAAAALAEPGPAAPAQSVETPDVPTGDGTHVVARRETLWGIAERYRPDPSMNINQVMLAIYRANPDAFAGNINRLNAGAVLRIPDRGAIEGVGRGEASAEVSRQNNEWQGAGPIERPARLELVPPQEAVPATATVAAPLQPATPQAEVAESRRLLAVKDAELQALRQRVAELERAGSQPVPAGEVAVEQDVPIAAEPVAAEPAATAPSAIPEQVDAGATEQEVAKPTRPAPAATDVPPSSGGFFDAVVGLLTSTWLWVAAAVVLVGALLLARRRSAAEAAPAWRPPSMPSVDDGDDRTVVPPVAARTGRSDMIVIEEPGRAQATGGFERRAVPRGDEELPLEKTISTDGPVNLDQSDPLAEADFHMAYGLYDQAADLLTAAMSREPARRDLLLKIVDVYFVWENRDGFLRQARALREHIGNDSDPDWKRVIIMGKQLCPGEAMFAGAALPDADDIDLSLSADSGGTVDLALDGADGGLDFDLSGGEADANAPTKVARQWSSAQTQEIATLEAPGIDAASTMETPTIESPALTSTMETPTIETARPGRTQETPTIEAPSPEFGSTARLQGLSSGDERQEQTAEIDLEDLGLDLTGLDDAARDVATGLQEALPDAGGDLDFDLSAGALPSDSEESTAEMENSPTLNQLTSAMGKSAAGTGLADDTAEQPGVSGAGDSMITPALSATSDELESLNIDLDLGAADANVDDLTATGLRAIGGRRAEEPTMTEVGTKLDLARAYVDMGDPDGARSILNEVLEEGDPAQRQEARQLLDSLDQ